MTTTTPKHYCLPHHCPDLLDLVLAEGISEVLLHGQPCLEDILLVRSLQDGLGERHMFLIVEARQSVMKVVAVLYRQRLRPIPGIGVTRTEIRIHLLIKLQTAHC